VLLDGDFLKRYVCSPSFETSSDGKKRAAGWMKDHWPILKAAMLGSRKWPVQMDPTVAAFPKDAG
jgi:hypothetical protein